MQSRILANKHLPASPPIVSFLGSEGDLVPGDAGAKIRLSFINLGLEEVPYIGNGPKLQGTQAFKQ